MYDTPADYVQRKGFIYYFKARGNAFISVNFSTVLLNIMHRNKVWDRLVDIFAFFMRKYIR